MLVKTLDDVSKFAGKLVIIKVGQSYCRVGTVDKKISLFLSEPGYNVDIPGDIIERYTLTQEILSSRRRITLELIEEK